MKCRNCNHRIEILEKNSFLKKYKDKNQWCHIRHRWNKFNPLRECHCGCLSPQPQKLKEAKKMKTKEEILKEIKDGKYKTIKPIERRDKDGNLVYKKYPDGTEYNAKYEDGNLVYQKYPDGTEYKYENGNLVYKKYPDGTEYKAKYEDGNLVYQKYSDGTEYKAKYEDGNLVYEKYSDGTEYKYKNGNLVYEKHSNGRIIIDGVYYERNLKR